MTDPVPAPEQQGEPVCAVCGHEREAHVGDDPNGQVCVECDGIGEHELMLHPYEPSTLPPAPEPVCQRCGHAGHERGCGVLLPEFGEGAECGCFNRAQTDDRPRCRTCGEPYRGWTVSDGVRTYRACATPVEGGTYEMHPFEPAPPSSEEAEAQWERWYEVGGSALWRNGLAVIHVPRPIEAAIRAPLEERVRELEALVANSPASAAAEEPDWMPEWRQDNAEFWAWRKFWQAREAQNPDPLVILDARHTLEDTLGRRLEGKVKALEEERDRLREQLATRGVQFLTAQAQKVAERNRAEAAEAQVAKLREAVLNFVNAWDEDMPLDGVGDSVNQYLRPALAEPEGGETQ